MDLKKVSDQVADDQLEIMIDYYEIDTEIMNEQNAEIVDSAMKNIKKAITHGRLEITLDEQDRIKIVQRMKGDPEKELSYKVLSGKAKAQMKDKDPSHKKIYTLMGSLSGVGANGIMQLEGADSSTVESLGTVFLQL